MPSFKQRHGNCKYYEPIEGKVRGYCRCPRAYYNGLQVYGWNRAADRCFEPRETDVEKKEKKTDERKEISI